MSKAELHKCQRCGADVPIKEKGYALIKRNVNQPAVTYTSASGKTYRTQAKPKKITTASYGLCGSCLIEAGKLLKAFCGGRKMIERPILFNGEMVRAILDGRKTQTRRVMKLKRKENEAGFQILIENSTGKFAYAEYYDEDENPTRMIEPPCRPDDILWVRETWSTHYDGIHDDLQFCYKADGIDLKSECLPGENNRWHPSIHMPKEAARIFLRVEDVRVEHLGDMRLEDCLAEGVRLTPGVENDLVHAPIWARKWFSQVWDSTIKSADRERYSWEANPWVWVIEFERCEKPEGWCGA